MVGTTKATLATSTYISDCEEAIILRHQLQSIVEISPATSTQPI